MSFRRRSAAFIAGVAAISWGIGSGVKVASAAAPVNLVVTTASDPSSGTACPATSGHPCSLRAAVAVANAAGASGLYLITFAVPGPFPLSSTGLTVNGGETLTILGNTDGSTITTGGSDRIITLETSSTLTLDNVVLTGGNANTTPTVNDGFGGAVDVNTTSHLTLLRSAVTTNVADSGGGGIDVNTGSTLTAIADTFSSNHANGTTLGEGGAIDDNTAASVTVINSTITGNSAGSVGGGGISAISSGSLQLVNDTITKNTAGGAATQGGGVLASGSAGVSIGNSIVTANTSSSTVPVAAGTANNCAGTITDRGNNLEQGTTCGFTTNAVNADPLLAPLAANGGIGMTFALDPGSPAIFAGSNAICTAHTYASPPGAGSADERGVARPQGAQCDIGAFEVVATTTALLSPSVSTQGSPVTLIATVTPRQAIPGAPQGTVSFYDGSTLLGTAATNGSGVASLTTSTLGAGAQPLKAVFTQTPLFLGSASSPAVVLVSVPVPATGGGIPVAALALLVLGIAAAAVALMRRRTHA